MQFLQSISHFTDTISEYSGRIVSWLTTILMLLICYDVAMRYLFNNTSIAIFEMEWHLYSLIFLLGAAYTLKHDKHVRVDVFYSKMSPKFQAWVNIIGALILLIPFCWIIILSSWQFTLNAFSINESSPDPGGLPARWLIKGAIPIGFTLLLIQAVSVISTSLIVILTPQSTT